MPYIDKAARGPLDRGMLPAEAGDLAYCVYRDMGRFVNARGKPRFIYFAIAVGAVILAMLEYWRRHIVDYEEARKAENGDVRFTPRRSEANPPNQVDPA